MGNAEYKDKFIGFVDILGWKELVKASDSGKGLSVHELSQILQQLGTPQDQARIHLHGPTTCPQSSYINYHLDFRLTQISDCVIVSSEVSPTGVINLINHCWGAVIMLLTKGIMGRGYITRGGICHTDEPPYVIGMGYQEAIEKEKIVSVFKTAANESGTPFVEVDKSISDYVRNYGDECVKKMFSRYVKEDGELIALFPFQRINHSFIVGNYHGHVFDREMERRSNQNVRLSIERMKKLILTFADQTKPNAVSKSKHYIAALDAQLELCLKTDECLDTLPPTFPSL